MDYPNEYSPDLLHPIARSDGRNRLAIEEPLPFSGIDIWNAYEISWLNPLGKPMAATGEFRFAATSPCIVESKSLKLYLSSLSGSHYDSVDSVSAIIRDDLSSACGAAAEVRIDTVDSPEQRSRGELPGVCIDDMELDVPAYDLDPELLRESTEVDTEVTETLHSHLLKSNCPVTGQLLFSK